MLTGRGGFNPHFPFNALNARLGITFLSSNIKDEAYGEEHWCLIFRGGSWLWLRWFIFLAVHVVEHGWAAFSNLWRFVKLSLASAVMLWKKRSSDVAASYLLILNYRGYRLRVSRSLEDMKAFSKRPKGYMAENRRLISRKSKSFNSGFARFNTIITSLKALNEGFSSKNYVRKFLRALHPKWRAKVTTIEESKDLSSLALDELIGNLKVHEVVMEKDSEIYRGKKERVKSIALKAKKESSDDETSTSGSDDEEYAMAVRNFKKFFRRKGKFVRQPREEKKSFRQRDEKKGKSDRKCFRCGDPNHLIGDCPKPSRNKDQKAFIGGSWSDSENDAKDKTNDETCLMAQSSNEVCLRTCLEPDEWIKDSGCSKHMTGNKSLFSTYKAYDGGNVVFGSNLKGKIIGKDGIFFNQSKYIKEMLKKFGLEDSKPTKTPMSTEIKLTKDDEADSVDSSKY
ncbi:copia protein [Tanacetum coccineum]